MVIRQCPILCILVLSVLFSSDSPMLAAEQSVDALEQQLLAHREAIISGHVRIESQHLRKGEPVRAIEYTIVFDRNAFRTDIAEDYNQSTVFFTDNGKLYTYTDRVVDGQRIVGTIRYGRSKIRRTVDLRKIGMIPTWCEQLALMDMRTILGSSQWTNDESPQRNGPTARWSYRRGDDSLEVVADTEKRNITEMTFRSGDTLQRIQCDLEHVPNYGFFPSRVHFLQSKGGDVQIEEFLDINVEQLNGSIPDTEFTFRAMGAEEGVSVHDFTVRGSGMFTLINGELVESDAAKTMQLVQSRRPWQFKRWIALACALVLAAIAILAVRQRQRS